MTHPTPPPDKPPSFTTPVGPVWIVETEDRNRPLRVRRLAGDPGLLKLGATLRHTGSSSHPRLKAPTEWWRSRDETWIAGPTAPGTRLADEPAERPTWSNAVEAITPLALALRDAHRSGVVHGLLAPWNVLFDEATGRITALDFGTWPHEVLELGPFCPPELLTEDQSASPVPATDVHNLARILLFLGLSPDEARRSSPNFETIPSYAISTLDRALKTDPAARPGTIDDFLAGVSFEPSGRGADLQRVTDETATGRVRDIELFDHPERGPGVRCRLHTPDEARTPGVFVYRRQNPDVYDSLALLWEGAELTLVDPRVVEDSQGRTFLSADDETLPVLQPNWPVSVSDVLKARGCPQRVMVDLRNPSERTHHLAFGTLVHQFLEDLTADPDLSFEEALDNRLPDLRLDFLASGVDDAQLAELIEDARNQFQHLRQFTARRTASSSRRDRVGWCGNHAEATRYSTRYGLEGRTDLVVTDPEEGLQIIELKSGKPWHDHPGQVKSYALLWRQLADRENMATTGHLLYSRDGRMKEVSLDGDGEREQLVHGRNRLVAMYRSFVDPGYDFRPPHYMEDPQLCREDACRFRRDRCRAMTAALGLQSAGDPDEPPVQIGRSYVRHWTRMVEMERWADHAALGAIFQPERLPQRVADGTVAADLELRPADADDRGLLVGQGLHVFAPGDRLLVHRGNVDAHHVLRARVVGRPDEPPTDHDEDDVEHLEVEFRAATLSDRLTGAGWIADDLPSRIGYRTAHRALYRLVDTGPERLREVLFDPAGAATETDDARADTQLHPATRRHLDDSQLAALRRGLVDDPTALVQGPPGTGKTTVIAHLCLELADRGETVLLSALTNTAVDTMLIKLLEAADVRDESPPPFLRLGSADRSPLLAQALEDRDRALDEVFADAMGAATESLDELGDRLDGVRIVATTAHSALRHCAMTYFEDQRGVPAFDVALVDEAGQLTEPMTLAPLTAADRFVLFGDHRQLPPIVTAERALTAFVTGPDRPEPATEQLADESSQPALLDTEQSDQQPPPEPAGGAGSFPVVEPLREAGVGGLDRSLFERLARFVDPEMLTTQYRMHSAIMEFPARAFYDDRLKAHDSVADRTLQLDGEAGDEIVVPDVPVVFVDVDGTEVGRTNPDEARAVVETTDRLSRLAPSASVGVLSPFRAQVDLLRRLHRRQSAATDVDIDTVERFQGGERDVICASLVKTDHPGDFVSDTRRLNVAWTRARMKLIVFGQRCCLVEDPLFRDWLDAGSTEIVEWHG